MYSTESTTRQPPIWSETNTGNGLYSLIGSLSLSLSLSLSRARARARSPNVFGRSLVPCFLPRWSSSVSPPSPSSYRLLALDFRSSFRLALGEKKAPASLPTTNHDPPISRGFPREEEKERERGRGRERGVILIGIRKSENALRASRAITSAIGPREWN